MSNNYYDTVPRYEYQTGKPSYVCDSSTTFLGGTLEKTLSLFAENQSDPLAFIESLKTEAFTSWLAENKVFSTAETTVEPSTVCRNFNALVNDNGDVGQTLVLGAFEIKIANSMNKPDLYAILGKVMTENGRELRETLGLSEGAMLDIYRFISNLSKKTDLFEGISIPFAVYLLTSYQGINIC